MILGVVSGHHSLPEAGRLMLVDPNLGTHYPFRNDPKSKEWGVPGTGTGIRYCNENADGLSCKYQRIDSTFTARTLRGTA
jgi:hypothetical protein